MARPKKVPVKAAPVKRTRRAKDPTHPDVAKVPEAWIDEQLRKECIQIAACNGSSITTLVEDARNIYYFVKGISIHKTELVLDGLIPGPVEKSYTSGLSQRVENEDGGELDTTLTTFPPKSKLDAHTL